MKKKTKKRIALSSFVLIAVLISPVIYLRGCAFYWHDAPSMEASTDIMSKKSIAVCSKRAPNEQNFEKALRKKGFRIVPYHDVQSIAPAEFEKLEIRRSGRVRNWLPPEVIEKVKNELGVDAILYEWSRPSKYLGIWGGHCEMSLMDIETGENLCRGWLDSAPALSKQGALNKIAKKTVYMMVKSAKSGKNWYWDHRPQWQKRNEE